MDIRLVVVAVLALLLGVYLFSSVGKAPSADLVVAQGTAGQIALLNVTSGKLATASAGPAVHGVGVLPDGKIAYAASYESNEVSVIDLKTGKLLQQIDVGGKSHHITVCPHGIHVFVTVATTNSVAVIDPGTNTVIARIAVGENPSYTVLTPDESKLYVTNMGSNNMSVIDTNSLQVMATVAVGRSPDHAAATSDSRLVYVTNGGSDDVSVIDTSSQQVVMTMAVGKGPHGIAAVGKLIYVGNRGATTLSVIDPTMNQVAQTLDLGISPEHLTASTDGKYLYIGSNADKSIVVLDTTNNRAVKKLRMRSEVHQIALVTPPAAQPEHAANTQANPATALTEADLTRTTKGAGIEVVVVFETPLMKSADKNKLSFKITLDTHSGDLMQYDLTRLAVLRTGTGVEVKSGFAWNGSSESSHHRVGALTVANVFDGKPVFVETADYLELELKDVGVASRIFKWTKQELLSRSY